MKLLKSLKAHPVMSGAAAVIVAVAGIAGAANAWGPERATFTMQNPAQYPVFNSITNNPNYGDERNFVTIKDVTAGGQFQSSVDLVEGHEYKVQIYIHNDASEKLNASGAGIARDTTVTAFMPSVVDGTAKAQATIAASNTNPLKVWDDAVMKSSKKVELQYISGSALLSRNVGNGNGGVQSKLSDTLLTTGVKVGTHGLDGSWYGCHGYAGGITFNFKVKEQPKADFTMDKQVRKHSTTTGGWVESYKAQPGEVVDFIIRYKNTGGVTQENVTVKDTLPKGLEYVKGSTVLANANNPNGKTINDDVTTKGVNIGSYTPGSNAWVRFSAKVTALERLECGTSNMRNIASVTTGAGTKSDDATVTTQKDCAPTPTPEQPIYRCDLLTVDKISRNSYKFSVKYTAARGATYKGTTYKVYDTQGKEVYSTANGDFNGFAAGNYTVKASVTVSVNGKDETVTSEACSKPVTIEGEQKPEQEKVCRLKDKTIVTINKSNFNSNLYSRNLDDCKSTTAPGEITVCVKETKSIVTIKENEFDSQKHTLTLSECAETPTTPTPVTPSTPTTPESPTTPTPTPTTPTTVTELPRTGINDVIGLVGVGSLGYAIYAYVASRRNG